MLHALILQLMEAYAQATPEFLTLARTQYKARDGIFYKDIQGMLRRVVPTPELHVLVLRTLHRESHRNSAKSLKQEICVMVAMTGEIGAEVCTLMSAVSSLSSEVSPAR